MFNALDINTKSIIATAKTRDAVSAIAVKLVGREGYCVRAVEEKAITVPANWCTTDGQWWN